MVLLYIRTEINLTSGIDIVFRLDAVKLTRIRTGSIKARKIFIGGRGGT